jgi:ectoine hydroxylase-related dioxygenase (phytanoyl-CoA dioxygenase family)
MTSGELRKSFLLDGFVQLPGLLARPRVLAARAQVTASLEKLGWLIEDRMTNRSSAGPVAHHDTGRMRGREAFDPSWRVGYTAVQSIEAFHALAHDDNLLDAVRQLLGERVVVHPRKIARISFPGLDFPTPPHQDCLFNEPAVDVVAAWIALGDYSAEDGTLRLLRGSAHLGPLPTRESDGLGGETVDISPSDPRWAGASYRAGDVVLFHSFTVHMATANRGSQVRLSLDARYQSAEEPIKLQSLLPHHFSSGVLPSWQKLTQGWSSTSWVDVPEAIRVAVAPQAHRRTSTLFPTVRGQSVRNPGCEGSRSP